MHSVKVSPPIQGKTTTDVKVCNTAGLRAGTAGAFSANCDHAVTSGGVLDLDGLIQTVLSVNKFGIVKLGVESGETLSGFL